MTASEKQNENQKQSSNHRLPSSSGVRAVFASDNDSLRDAVLKKKANIDTLGMGGAMDTVRMPVTYVDPLFDPVLTLFPKENIYELNRRLRHYYNYHPIVRNVINTHIEFSLSDFELTCSDPEIAKIYNDEKEKLGLTELMMQAGRDYYLLGEAYLYGQWSDTDNCWSSFLQYPPENIEIFRTYVGSSVLYMLKPDQELISVLKGTSAQSQAIRDSIPEDFRNAILSGKPYILNNSQMIHLANKPTAYIPRGVSIVTSVLKYLLLEDKLLLLLMSNIDRNMNPIKLWKLGDAGKGLMPTKRQIAEFRALLMQASNDPDFNIVTHPFVTSDFVTPVGKFDNLMQYFEFIYKRLLIGLFASDEFLKGSTSSFASASVSVRLVMQRYLAFRTRIENIIRQRIFKPIAIANKFLDKSGQPILPVLRWKARNLLNEQSERDFFMRLRDKGEIPFRIIAEAFGLDYEAVRRDLEDEQATVFDPVLREVIREKAKDKGIGREMIKGKTVREAIEAGAEQPDKPQSKSLFDGPLGAPEKGGGGLGLGGPTGLPPRSVPLEKPTDVKPVGGEAPAKPAPAGPGGAPPAPPTPPTPSPGGGLPELKL